MDITPEFNLLVRGPSSQPPKLKTSFFSECSRIKLELSSLLKQLRVVEESEYVATARLVLTTIFFRCSHFQVGSSEQDAARNCSEMDECDQSIGLRLKAINDSLANLRGGLVAGPFAFCVFAFFFCCCWNVLVPELYYSVAHRSGVSCCIAGQPASSAPDRLRSAC